ncbi:hypothetical protein BOX15_Mlig006977g1 [Macrostomum lignano]|uniref:alpha-1,2-Mannosidase n=1 Tax=Macrostomum lignano TaxID=282301 RepID=A0A267GET5_9PLAT|nr:hypothetical protein BOX15_Mlig005504g1 [Macrostomum lignano]PAA84506.1 hypothetical protein BOX15_Mlig006977g1 [Macrostomum lignano]
MRSSASLWIRCPKPIQSPRPTQAELTEPRTDGRNSTTLTVPCRQQQQQEKHQHPDSAELLGCRCKNENDEYSFALRQPCYTQTQLPQSSASGFHTRVGGSNAERQNLKPSATSPDSDVGADTCCNLSKRYARRIIRALRLASRCACAKRRLVVFGLLLAAVLAYILLMSLQQLSRTALTAAAIGGHGRSRNGFVVGVNVGGGGDRGDDDDDGGDETTWFQRRLGRVQTDSWRAEAVREMMRFAWRGYLRHCAAPPFLGNELAPALNSCSHASNDLVGAGRLLTAVDSLDTLLVMGLGREFHQARDLLRRHYHPRLDNSSQVSVFETTIRMLGGLLGAYSLTEDPIFARKAAELGNSMAGAFGRLGAGGGDPDKSAWVALSRIRLNDNSDSLSEPIGMASRMLELTVNLAETGSLYLEFAYLSEVTGDPKYARWARLNQANLMQVPNIDGVYPIHIAFNSRSQPPESTDSLYSAGAEGDSFYEYLVKRCLFDAASPSGSTGCRRSFGRSLDGLTKHLGVLVPTGAEKGAGGGSPACLIKTSLTSNLASGRQQAEREQQQFKGPQLARQCSMEHLTCFAGGMYALAYLQDRRRQDWLRFAENITRACYLAYEQSPTGLGPEGFIVSDEFGRARVSPTQDSYVLRPETVESIYYLYQVTGDPMYREWGWKIVQSLNRSARTGVGFSGITGMYVGAPPAYDNTQWSFFLAETLKYLYLLLTPSENLPLDQWLFNTEAHLIPTFANPLRRRLARRSGRRSLRRSR